MPAHYLIANVLWDCSIGCPWDSRMDRRQRAQRVSLCSTVFSDSGRKGACKIQSTGTGKIRVVREKAMRTQSNLSVQKCLQPVPPQVHLSKTLSKFCPFIPLAFHITSAHLQEWLVNKIYHPLLKVHFHHIFLEGKKHTKKPHKTISLAVLIRSVPMMLQGIVMGHSQLILNHGLKYFSERDLAVAIILNFYHSIFV